LLITALLLAEIAATLGDVGGTVVVLPMFATYIVPFSVVWTKTGLEPKGRLVVTGVRLVSAYDEIVSSRLFATYIRLPFGNKAACTGPRPTVATPTLVSPETSILVPVPGSFAPLPLITKMKCVG